MLGSPFPRLPLAASMLISPRIAVCALTVCSSLLLAGVAGAQSGLTVQLRYTLDGDAPGDFFGTGLSSADDLDHDGLPDFCVGSGQGCAGLGYVRAFRGLDGATLWTRVHTGSNCDHFGQCVELVGDMDGDGLSDLAVGAPQTNWNCGKAYLISTQTLAPIHTFNGACSAPDDRFGSSVGRLGDITGDGVPEFTIVASSADPLPGHYIGTIQCFNGATGQALWQANGTQSYDYARQKLGKDINGDGVQEVTWHSGQHGFSPVGPGFIRLHDGATGIVLHQVSGVNVDDHFGDQWTLLGDVTGDGVYDMVVGVPNGDTFGPDQGEIQVLSGVDGSLVYSVPVPAGNPNHGWGGESGGSMCELPDIDQDGFPDFACGFGYAFDPAVGSSKVSGAVGIYSGASGALLETLVGEQDGDLFGYQVRLVTNLTGAGTTSLIVSAIGHDKGRIYVYDFPDPDCNGNGIPDSDDIANGSLDCNLNGTPDECELALDPSLDWDGNGVLDSCAGGGPSYCFGNINAAGNVGSIEASGSPLIIDNNLTLSSHNLPIGQPGYYLFSANTGYVNPFGGGAGVLCLGAPIRRLNTPAGYPLLFVNATGDVSLTLDLGNLPGTILAPGDIYIFQLWHRENDPVTGNPTANTTDSMRLMFR